jgi:hypothetical protein
MAGNRQALSGGPLFEAAAHVFDRRRTQLVRRPISARLPRFRAADPASSRPNADASLTTGRAGAATLRCDTHTHITEAMTKQPQLPKGHSSILSPEFKYVPAVKTDLAKTFARIRERRLAQSRRGTGVSNPVPATSTV